MVEFISIPPGQVNVIISVLGANRVGKIFVFFFEYLVDFISIPPVQVHFTISGLGANRICLTFALFLLHFLNREQYYNVTGEELSKNITCFLNQSFYWWTKETERDGRIFFLNVIYVWCNEILHLFLSPVENLFQKKLDQLFIFPSAKSSSMQ